MPKNVGNKYAAGQVPRMMNRLMLLPTKFLKKMPRMMNRLMLLPAKLKKNIKKDQVC